MLTTYSSRGIFLSKLLFPYLSNKKNGQKLRENYRAATHGSNNSGDNLGDKQKTSLKIRFPNTTFIAQSAIAVLGLGFIDAGYSGDWSRIGVISKGTEDLLKILAFLVVPLCFYLIFSLSKRKDA